MVKLGGRLAFTHLDIIAVRCDYLSIPNTRVLFRTAAELVDNVITISQFSKVDFAAFYGTSLPFEVIPLGAHDDPPVIGIRTATCWWRATLSPRGSPARGRQAAGCRRHIVTLDGEDASGDAGGRPAPLSRSAIAGLYDGAAVVVYPSLYEGFGLPIVDASPGACGSSRSIRL